jgi:hypothetical protein
VRRRETSPEGLDPPTMKQRSITASEANALLIELRAMSLLPPGEDADTLARARDICSLLRAQQHGGRTVGQSADRALSTLDISPQPPTLEAGGTEHRDASQADQECV